MCLSRCDSSCCTNEMARCRLPGVKLMGVPFFNMMYMVWFDCGVMVSNDMEHDSKRNNKSFLFKRVDLVLDPHDLASPPGARPVPFSLLRLLQACLQPVSLLCEPGVPLVAGHDVFR